ncbi:unnamed protein product, partial [Brenthis ino]
MLLLTRIFGDTWMTIKFQQNNAPCHQKSATTMGRLKENEIVLLDSPAQSPDLDTIEHLWGHLIGVKCSVVAVRGGKQWCKRKGARTQGQRPRDVGSGAEFELCMKGKWQHRESARIYSRPVRCVDAHNLVERVGTTAARRQAASGRAGRVGRRRYEGTRGARLGYGSLECGEIVALATSRVVWTSPANNTSVLILYNN